MTTVQIEGWEHVVEVYNVSSGLGITLCDKPIRPRDGEPRYEVFPTCGRCLEIQKTNDQPQEGRS